jgi:hypothetical protein
VPLPCVRFRDTHPEIGHRVVRLFNSPLPNEGPPERFFRVPFDQNYAAYRTIHARTSVPPESLQPQVEAQVRELAPGIPISEVQTMPKRCKA